MLVFKFEIFYQASMLQIGDCNNLYMMVLLFIESLLHLSSIEGAFPEQVVFSKHPMHIQYIQTLFSKSIDDNAHTVLIPESMDSY